MYLRVVLLLHTCFPRLVSMWYRRGSRSARLSLHDELGHHHLHGGRDAALHARLLEALRHVQDAPAVVLLVVVLLLARVDQLHHVPRQHLACTHTALVHRRRRAARDSGVTQTSAYRWGRTG